MTTSEQNSLTGVDSMRSNVVALKQSDGGYDSGDASLSARRYRSASNRRRRDLEQDSYAATALGDVIDRSLHATLARFTLGLSPAALGGAYLDWATHLAASPGKQAQLFGKAARKIIRLAHHARQCALQGGMSDPCIEPLPQDRRFVGEAWRRWPYNFIYQSFLLNQQWWHNATTSVRGVTKQHENVVEFVSRQILDMVTQSRYL